MILQSVTYWRVPRDDNGRPDRTRFRVFDMALRWQPELDGDDAAGVTHLVRLRGGDAVSDEHLTAARAYLAAAIVFYRSDEPEPYPSRNAEAAANLAELLEALS